LAHLGEGRNTFGLVTAPGPGYRIRSASRFPAGEDQAAMKGVVRCGSQWRNMFLCCHLRAASRNNLRSVIEAIVPNKLTTTMAWARVCFARPCSRHSAGEQGGRCGVLVECQGPRTIRVRSVVHHARLGPFEPASARKAESVKPTVIGKPHGYRLSETDGDSLPRFLRRTGVSCWPKRVLFHIQRNSSFPESAKSPILCP